MSVAAYVAVVSELADVSRFPPDGSAEVRDALADSVRQQILDRYGVTAEQLLDFAREAGRSPDVMESIMEEVSAVTDSLAAQRAAGNAPATDVFIGTDSAAPIRSAADSAARVDRDEGPRDGIERFRRARLLRELEAARDSAAVDTAAASPPARPADE